MYLTYIFRYSFLFSVLPHALIEIDATALHLDWFIWSILMIILETALCVDWCTYSLINKLFSFNFKNAPHFLSNRNFTIVLRPLFRHPQNLISSKIKTIIFSYKKNSQASSVSLLLVRTLMGIDRNVEA